MYILIACVVYLSTIIVCRFFLLNETIENRNCLYFALKIFSPLILFNQIYIENVSIFMSNKMKCKFVQKTLVSSKLVQLYELKQNKTKKMKFIYKFQLIILIKKNIRIKFIHAKFTRIENFSKMSH